MQSMRIGRRAIGFALILILVVAGCGTERSTPSSLVSLNPSAPRTPQTTVPPATPAATLDAEGYLPVTLDHSRVHTAVLHADFRFHALSSDGPLVVLDDLPGNWPGSGRYIYLANLLTGVVNAIHVADEGDRAVSPVIETGRVAWLDWSCSDPGNKGNLRWALYLHDVEKATTQTIANGIHERHPENYCANWPAFALSRDYLAYAIEDGSRGPDGWKVVVVTLPANRVVREIQTDRPVYDVGIDDDGNVAFTTGLVDPTWAYMYEGKLYAARAGQDVVQVQDESYAVSVRDGRIAWEHSATPPAPAPGATRDPSTGASRAARAWTASFADLIAQPVSPGPYLGHEIIQRSFSTGNDLVIWDSPRVQDKQGGGETVDRLCVWRPDADEPYELSTPSAMVNDVGGGWITWSNHIADPPAVQGMALEDLHLP